MNSLWFRGGGACGGDAVVDPARTGRQWGSEKISNISMPNQSRKIDRLLHDTIHCFIHFPYFVERYSVIFLLATPPASAAAACGLPGHPTRLDSGASKTVYKFSVRRNSNNTSKEDGVGCQIYTHLEGE